MDIPNKFCHNCGTKLLSSAKFCSSCGTSLASIDEKPPVAQPARRVQPQETFEPTIVGANKGKRDYDDDETIRADRVESLSELGIRMTELDIMIEAPRSPRESMASVVAAGAGLPAGYKEPARPAGAIASPDAAREILKEGAALKPGSISHEIKP